MLALSRELSAYFPRPYSHEVTAYAGYTREVQLIAVGMAQTRLMLLAGAGNTVGVTALLDASIDSLTVVDAEGSTALMIACRKGHTKTVVALLVATTRYNEPPSTTRTYILTEVPVGTASLIKALIEAEDMLGTTPLMMAAKNGHSDTVEVLLNALETSGEITSAVNRQEHGLGHTALMMAADGGHFRVVKQLIAVHNVNLNAVGDIGENAWTMASMQAVSAAEGLIVDENYRLCADALEQAPSFDINAASPLGVTALIVAAAGGQRTIVAHLLQAPHINVDAADWRGWTPLMRAANEDRYNTILFLLVALAVPGGPPGIDVNAIGDGGVTAYTLAQAAGHIVVARILATDPSFDPNTSNDQGHTGLMVAANSLVSTADDTSTLFQTVTVHLSTPGIDVNQVEGPPSLGYTAIMFAAKRGHNEVVSSMLKLPGIDVNVASDEGETVFTILAERAASDPTALARLIMVVTHPNFDINAPDSNGDSALILAAAAGHVATMAHLLAVHSCDAQLANQNGDTALSVATAYGHADVVSLLQAQ